ncbi:MAG: hypothetical protein KAS32_16680 [Candidatus Peribacteraceae bacterium]|nr:hypothetical protein [Candidatus Peribacteraceae bacterium]
MQSGIKNLNDGKNGKVKRFIFVLIAAFFQILFIGIQTKTMQHNQIILTGFVACGIGIFATISIRGIMDSFETRVAFVIGGTLGAMASIPLYHIL